MNQQVSPGKKRFRIIPALLITGVVMIVFAAGGFAFAATQEAHDSFCVSCHTQPESTFVNRSTSAPVDLASYHTTQQTACIDCHSGQGVFGRMQAELMGARNAFKWFTGTAIQPAVAQSPINNESCLKCHQDITARGFTPKESIAIPGVNSGRQEEDRANHWHAFLSRWQAAVPTAGTCLTCHVGHAAGGTAQNGFMNAQTVQDACNSCHQVIRRGN